MLWKNNYIAICKEQLYWSYMLIGYSTQRKFWWHNFFGYKDFSCQEIFMAYDEAVCDILTCRSSNEFIF